MGHDDIEDYAGDYAYNCGGNEWNVVVPIESVQLLGDDFLGCGVIYRESVYAHRDATNDANAKRCPENGF